MDTLNGGASVLRRTACLNAIAAVALVLLFLVTSFHVVTLTAAGSISLRPPYNGTYRLTSFFDHNYPNYGTDNEITIYTGESVADCSPHCYEGHPGYDWSMIQGTPVLAASDGVVTETFVSNILYGNSIVIQHDNGYHTLYAHLREPNPFNVVAGQRVKAGDVIGWSGNTGQSGGAHLHFGVYRGLFTRRTNDEDYATDPFGWRGSYPDPLLSRPSPGDRHTATCLWRSSDADPVSCADTIVEDAARGFSSAGTWLTSTRGNGFHMTARRNTTDTSTSTQWFADMAPAGAPSSFYKLYAYIPSISATTQSAAYRIWTITGWQTRTISQQSFTDTWPLLGTYRIWPNQAFVILRANTGEPVNTKWIAADAIKFRVYRTFLPAVLKNYPPPPVAPCGQNAMQNAGFESGPPGPPWGQSSQAGNELISGERAHSGAWSARFAGYNNALDKLYQGFTVPISATQATFEFWWYMTSSDSSVTPFDYLDVTLQSPLGTDLTAPVQINNTNTRGQWIRLPVVFTGLGSWIGQPMWLNFAARTDSTLATTFFVDDVSFVIQCDGVSGSGTGDTLISPLPTPTPSPTP